MAIESRLVPKGRLRVSIRFPGAKADWRDAADWTMPDTHKTVFEPTVNTFIRSQDAIRHFGLETVSRGGEITETAPHRSELFWSESPTVTFSLSFSTRVAPSDSAAHWKTFWNSGGAIDHGGSTNPRAMKLERRIRARIKPRRGNNTARSSRRRRSSWPPRR